MLENGQRVGVAVTKQDGFILQPPDPDKRRDFEPFGRDGFSFSDLIDIINPLQHIPLVSTLYREITGDAIDPLSKLVGSTLYGGSIGAVTSLVNIMVEYNTGKDVGEHALDETRFVNNKLENASNTESQNRGVPPTSVGNSENIKTSHPRIHQNTSSNPFLNGQASDRWALTVVLAKKIKPGENINTSIRSIEKYKPIMPTEQADGASIWNKLYT